VVQLANAQSNPKRVQESPNVLELVNAVHALGFLGRVDEAAESRLELLSARAVSHTTKARAIPVDLARLGVERTLLLSFLLEGFR
jgi:hypothetical protein